MTVPVMVTVLVDGDTVETDDTEITKIDLGNSYRCESGNSYTLTSNNSKVYLTLANLQLQAFKFINHAEFGKGLCLICNCVFSFNII